MSNGLSGRLKIERRSTKENPNEYSKLGRQQSLSLKLWFIDCMNIGSLYDCYRYSNTIKHMLEYVKVAVKADEAEASIIDGISLGVKTSLVTYESGSS